MKIKTKNGCSFLIDDEDYKKISKYHWMGWMNISTDLANPLYRYVISNGYDRNGKRKTILLHRLILNAPEGVEVDHINMNGLDNRKKNLRLCNRSQNRMNIGKFRSNTSGYKGVSWKDDNNRWEANIQINGKQKYIGLFVSKTQAAVIYNKAAIKLHGEFARLNEIGFLGNVKYKP